MAKHTPEPWEVLKDETYPEVVFIKSDGGPFVSGDIEEANAARIVQCVNACAGIDDPHGAIELAQAVLRQVYWADTKNIEAALSALSPNIENER